LKLSQAPQDGQRPSQPAEEKPQSQQTYRALVLAIILVLFFGAKGWGEKLLVTGAKKVPSSKGKKAEQPSADG
jgi:hypothetical protein